jgi:hypothetical protein
LDTALEEALAPVLSDLESTGSVIPEVRDEPWLATAEQVTAMLYSADGSGQGISARPADPLPERIASVADQVQEWVVEELCSVGRPTNWPQCPQHPHSHPLTAVERDGRAVWACPTTAGVVREIGQLANPAG